MADFFSCRWDESGADPGTETRSKSNRPILMVAGYIAHADEWLKVEERWKAILEEYGLDRFHMRDFCNFKRPYSCWTDECRDKLIGSLLDVIRDLPRLSVAWSLRIDDYMNVIKADNLMNTDVVRAYHILARRCIEVISLYARVAGHNKRILHIFDQGNSAWPTFEASFNEQMLDSLNILKPISQSNKHIVSLQVADILVHQLARHRVTYRDGTTVNRRMYMNRPKGKPGFVRHIERAELKEIYREEIMLDNLKALGSYPVRTMRRPPTQHELEGWAELFRDPSTYWINKRLRDLQ